MANDATASNACSTVTAGEQAHAVLLEDLRELGLDRVLLGRPLLPRDRPDLASDVRARMRATIASAWARGRRLWWTGWRILVEPQLGLYVVLDGMGGHPAGDVAARVGGHAIAISVRQRGRMRRRWPRQVLERALRIAASEVFRAGEERPEYHYMGTTVVACLVAPTRAVIGHVGDSRAYLLRDGELAALTRDHSVVQQLLDAGEITPRKAKRHPERQRLTANLGRGAWVLPEVTELRLREGDRLLLCSDGLHGYAPASAIRRVLAGRGGAEEIARRLVELALRCMTPDNVSAVVIAVEGGGGEGGGRRRQVVRRGGIGAVGRRRVRR